MPKVLISDKLREIGNKAFTGVFDNDTPHKTTRTPFGGVYEGYEEFAPVKKIEFSEVHMTPSIGGRDLKK